MTVRDVLGARCLPALRRRAGIAGMALLAALSVQTGLLVERWLFFAEAKHTVMLYYGASA